VLLSSTLISGIPFSARGSAEANELNNVTSTNRLPNLEPQKEEATKIEPQRPEAKISTDERLTEIKQARKDNHAPRANAGPDVTVNENQEVTLNAGRSSDVDGGEVSFLWTQISPGKPKVDLKDSDSKKTSFVAPEIDTKSLVLTFSVTVQDVNGGKDIDTVKVKVNNLQGQRTDQTTDKSQEVNTDNTTKNEIKELEEQARNNARTQAAVSTNASQALTTPKEATSKQTEKDESTIGNLENKNTGDEKNTNQNQIKSSAAALTVGTFHVTRVSPAAGAGDDLKLDYSGEIIATAFETWEVTSVSGNCEWVDVDPGGNNIITQEPTSGTFRHGGGAVTILIVKSSGSVSDPCYWPVPPIDGSDIGFAKEFFEAKQTSPCEPITIKGETEATVGNSRYGVGKWTWDIVAPPDPRSCFENSAPTANAQDVTTTENTTKIITLTGSDPEDDPLNFTVTAEPEHGNLTGTVPSLTYTPDEDYTGPDQFTFKVNDGTQDSNIATVSIMVEAIQCPSPTGSNAQALSLQCNVNLDLYKPDGATLISEGLEESPGGLAFVNNDNDDKDSVNDLTDSNGVKDEDELIKLVVEAPASGGTLSLAKGGSNIRIWESPEKTGLQTLPLEVSASKVLWIEGVSPSNLRSDIMFNLESKNDPSQKDKVTLTVLQVKDIKISGKGNGFNDDNNLDANSHPSKPVGVRVFPDARLENSKIGPARDSVTIDVELNLVVPFDTDLFLRSFDVDDPSLIGGQLDDESNAEDNRGEVNGHKFGMFQLGQGNLGISKLTFFPQESHKTTEFMVTKQPGDNFRIVAHNDRNFLDSLKNDDKSDGIDVVDSSSGQKIQKGYVSDVLTVWRHLQYELDSMYRLTDLCASGQNNNPQQLKKLAKDLNRDKNDSPGTDDFCILPKTPDVGFLTKLSNAYINAHQTANFASIDKKDLITFTHHIVSGSNGRITPASICVEKRDAINFNTNDFWSIYIVSAFEGDSDEDRDPDKEDALMGLTPFIDNSDDNCVIIYQEVIRDSMGDPLILKTAKNRETVERFIVLHESGHALNLEHPFQGTQYTCDRTLMDSDWPLDFIDKNENGKWEPKESVCPMPNFLPQDLVKLRSIQRPGFLP
jgi:hypothetical protein